MGRLGGDASDAQEIRVLNRIIRWTAEGLEYEADPRHAELLVSFLGDEAARPVITAGLKEGGLQRGCCNPDADLGAQDVKLFRAGAARAKSLEAPCPRIPTAPRTGRSTRPVRRAEWRTARRAA